MDTWGFGPHDVYQANLTKSGMNRKNTKLSSPPGWHGTATPLGAPYMAFTPMFKNGWGDVDKVAFTQQRLPDSAWFEHGAASVHSDWWEHDAAAVHASAEGCASDIALQMTGDIVDDQSDSEPDPKESHVPNIPLPRFVLTGDKRDTTYDSGSTTYDSRSSTNESGISEDQVPPPPPRPPIPAHESFDQEGIGCLSLGSAGHPTNCAAACKYIKKKRGCRDGARCRYCHLCQWHHLSRWRKTKNEDINSAPDQIEVEYAEPKDVSTQVDMPSVEGRVGKPGCPPSVGSIDHPFGCGPACRYTWRMSGCRSGETCFCCHLCQWSRHL